MQSGAGIAARLFSELPPAAVTTLRLWAAALIMLAIGGRGAARVVADLVKRRAWRDAVATGTFGIFLAVMNFAIYQAFAADPPRDRGHRRIPRAARRRGGGRQCS